jgi:thiamine-monophosphate kinase
VNMDSALHGGEDYELLFTAPPGKHVASRIAGTPITQIGHVTRGKRIFLIEQGEKSELLPQGWQHFAR